MKYVIYAIENKLNGKTYVGQTTNFKLRLLGHRSSYSKSHLSADVQQLGLTAFDVRILDEAETEKEARAKERLYIHLLEANDPERGYNNPYIYSVTIAERQIDLELKKKKIPWYGWKTAIELHPVGPLNNKHL